MSKIKNIDVAAALFGCDTGELIKSRECEDGSVVIIAPTGQKFIYGVEEIDAKREKMESLVKPKRKPRARKAAASPRGGKTPKVVRKPGKPSLPPTKVRDPEPKK